MRVAKEGLRFILAAVCAGVLCGALGVAALAVFFLLLAGAFAFFFRDPERVPPADENLLVSPADGEVLGVEPVDAAPGLHGPATKVTIFLSLLDVHVVRAPLAAAVASVDHRAGRFRPAYRPEAGEHNESTTLALTGGRVDAVLKMIVGVAARRIKTFVKPGEAVVRGQRIGLMFFGSRIELSVPRSITIKAGLHDKVKAGETVIAEVEP
jgi:phosphatidylserine decarboxylase